MQEARMKLGIQWPSTPPKVDKNPHGWVAEGTEKVLKRHLRPEMKVIVELGVWLGKSTRFFVEQCPNATIYSVDLWDVEHLTQWAASKHPHLIGAARQPLPTFMVNLWEHRHRVVPIQSDSIKAMAALKAAGVVPDLVYLDTSHLYPATLHEVRAIKAAFPTAQFVGDDWEWGNRKHGQAVERSGREYVAEAPQWALEVEGNGWALVNSFELLTKWYEAELRKFLGQDPLNWAITPIQARAMIREFNDRKAKVVVELGAGLSSLMFRQWAAQTGARVYSVDTDLKWLKWVGSLLREQGLSDADIHTLDEFRAISTKDMADAVFIDHGVDGSHDTRIRDIPWASDITKPGGILLIDDWRTHATANKSTRYARRAQGTLTGLGWKTEVLAGCRATTTEKAVALATRTR